MPSLTPNSMLKDSRGGALAGASVVAPALLEERLAKERSYWLDQLTDVPTPIGLPIDRSRQAEHVLADDKVPIVFEEALGSALLRLCGGNRSLALAVLVAALKVCLHKYHDARDVVVGTAIHERHGEVASLNRVLALRTRVAPDTEIRHLLASVKQTLADAFANQKFPYERLLELLGLELSPQCDPLVRCGLVLEDIQRVQNLETLQADALIAIRIQGDGIAGAISYNRSVLQRDTVEIFARHFARALAAMIDRPETTVGELELLAPSERQQWIVEPAPERDRFRHQTVSQAFGDQVRQTPAATALIFEDRELSYAEVNLRCQQRAEQLRQLGIGRGDRVGILLERSPDLVVAILAVLETGAAYVPLDIDHPPARTRDVIAEAGIRVLIADQVSEALPAGVEVLGLIRQATAEGPLSHEPVSHEPSVGASDAAYVIFTSGSTGRPKGVQISHGALMSYLSWAADTYAGDQQLSFGLSTSAAFDLTVTCLLLPLITGGRMVIYGDRKADPNSILEDDRAHVLKLTPSHLALIKDRDHCGLLLRRLIVGGEALPTELARQVSASFDHRIEIYNEYGPTEATVGCMVHRFDPQDSDRSSVSIGRAAAGAVIYLLDRNFEMVAENVAGEIFIGGRGLADGYLGRPALTAERFLPHPFSNGERVYRTGDLARRLADGNLLFLGRRDDQIKFLGHRIELDEVRCELSRHSEVQDCAVVLAAGGSRHELLVAYYVADQEIAAEDLRDFLTERLIEASIPNIFVQLSSLPLGLNGKLERRALPSLSEVRDKVQRAYIAPRTTTEELIAAMWAELLGFEKVGRHDNFFELGGHSLVAIQAISRARETFHVDISLQKLFQARTVAAFSESIDSASRQAESLVAPEIQRVSRDDSLPLSFAQERLWVLDQLEPGTPAYNIVIDLRLEGLLDVDILDRSLSEVVRRHEGLRTVFRSHEGRPIQVILPEIASYLRRVDLSHLETEQREAEALLSVKAETSKGFDLATGPLMRSVLLRLGDQDHLLVLTLHHIISDGWSLDLMIREMVTLYLAFSRSQPSPLAELPIQYADFSHWQRDWLKGEVLERQMELWRRRLADVPPLQLPVDRPRPALQTFAGANLGRDLPPELCESLQKLGRREGVTPFITFLAAFEVLLARYSGQNDFAVGTFVAGRSRTQIESLVGFFVNNLALRAVIDEDDSFTQLLRKTRDESLAAHTHQDVPFEKLIDELQPTRDLSRTPIFQVMLSYQLSASRELEVPGLRVKPRPVVIKRSNFDVTLWIDERPEGQRASFHYNTDLFDAATIERMLSHLQTLLEEAVAVPERSIADLRMLSRSEREQLIDNWSYSQPALESPLVHEAFAAQAQRSPRAVAVAGATGEWTYRQLDRRANQLARYLQSLGVGPETPVGLSVERSPEMIWGLFGILKAGACYLPLDPTYPRQRLETMLEDTGAQVIVTTAGLAEAYAARNLTMVRLDTESATIAAHDETAPPAEVDPANLAYVIYTSASTGRPKGVAITHRSLAAYHRTAADQFAIESGDRILQFASISFDTAGEEIYPCLSRGATLVLRNEEMLRSAHAFVEGCRELKLTVLDLPTAYWNQAVAQIAAEDLELPKSVRLVILGGERALPERLNIWNQRVGSRVRLVNTYGPTEATIVATLAELEAAEPSEESTVGEVSIGSPIAGARTYVVDRRSRPVPVGVHGQLLIGGTGLARGYWGRAARTAAAFMPDGWSGEAGARLYCSGDLVRYRTDGELEFIGRIDHQVKVRGFRVELGEIESSLSEAPGVLEAVVDTREPQPGDTRLVAWLVCDGAAEPTAVELRGFLLDRLPEFMIPAAYVPLPELPKLPNGKIDRRGLPDPDGLSVRIGNTYVAPRNEEEEMLAEIWCEVLDVERVGVFDSFFELGGHSLLATQLTARIRSALGVEVPLRKLFEAPTIAEMALVIDEILLAELEDMSDEEALEHAAELGLRPEDPA
ncbi:MAG: amino acid adenylation domain-containing protein [Acidobacteriota bacterium]